ncbi:hypothetical protein [Solimicrobium silvestre]|nr:hypothetical protein [Solimicrobium silvestre]
MTTTQQKQPKQLRVQRGILGGPLNLRLTPDEMIRVEKYAADEFRSRASFLRVMILAGLEQYERNIAINQ